jgi:hypothetical protein
MTCDDDNTATLNTQATAVVVHPTEGPPKSESSKGGAPRGNQNSVTNGLRMRLPATPPGCGHIARELRGMNVWLENAVVDSGGILDGVKKSRIRRALAGHRKAALAARYLRLNGSTMSPDQYLAFINAQDTGEAERDRALAKLGIDKAAVDPLDALYGPKK